MRKCVVLLLALALVVALGASAYAASDCTITVNNAMQGETYTAYKMLDVAVSEATTTEGDYASYVYTLSDTSKWKGFFATGAGKDYVVITEIDSISYVTWKEGNSISDFATVAVANTTGKDVAGTVKADDTKTATFTGLEPGYYLITSSGGTKVIVDTTPVKPNATINDKNEAPTLEKEVQGDSTGAWGEKNTAQIGDTVNFKVKITVQPGALNYVMHDKMDDGLTFSGADSVAIDGLANTNYSVVTNPTDGCTFEIAFDQTYLNSITKNTTLTVTYCAVLNENAKAGEAELNTAYLKYGSTDNTSSKTPEKQTETYTYDFSLLKYAGDAADKGNEGTIDLTSKSALAGAEFRLEVKNEAGTFETVNLIKVSDTQYRIAKDGETDAVDKFTTVADGKITITGIDNDDTYQLVEVKAPLGYNLLDKPVEVKLGDKTTIDLGVANYAGTELPSTGGTGTAMIYLAGSVLVVAALVLFITKRRMDAGR